MRWHELSRHLMSRSSISTAVPIIYTVIKSLGDRVFTDRTASMISNIRNVRRKKTLVSFMYTNRHICPPQKRLNKRRPIVSAYFQLKDSAFRMQADTMHPFHAGHRIVVAAPYSFRAIGVFFDADVDRQKCRRTMMLRPIELDTSTDPRACQPN